MVKIKTWELLFKVSSFNSSFFFYFFFSILILFVALFMLVHVCLGQSYNSFHVLGMLGCQILILKFCSVYVFLGFQGKRLRTHNLACARRLVLLCGSRCPKNLIFFLSILFLPLHICSIWFLLICFRLHKFLFSLYTCFVCYHMFRLRFLSSNAMPFIHMSMH